MTVHQRHGEGHEQMQRGGADDGQAEYLVGRELGGDEAAGNLRHQIAPEEGRVHMALHGNGPVHKHGLKIHPGLVTLNGSSQKSLKTAPGIY